MSRICVFICFDGVFHSCLVFVDRNVQPVAALCIVACGDCSFVERLVSRFALDYNRILYTRFVKNIDDEIPLTAEEHIRAVVLADSRSRICRSIRVACNFGRILINRSRHCRHIVVYVDFDFVVSKRPCTHFSQCIHSTSSDYNVVRAVVVARIHLVVAVQGKVP